jgi:RNA polymerase sigma-70 factor (ECF subfamily)
VRQIARRAREHVADRRLGVDVSRSEQRAVAERFVAALRSGQMGELMEVMAPDVILIADGGGIAPAAPAPISGAGLVAPLLSRAERPPVAFEATMIWLNGAAAARVEIDKRVAAVCLAVENDRVKRIYAIANPEKLTRLAEVAELTR